MKNLFLNLLFLIPILAIGQTTKYANISGFVLSADGKPAVGITVKVLPEERTTSTDKDGRYAFNNLAEGKHILAVSAIGLQTQQREITVHGQRFEVSPFQLAENQSRLREIVINAKRDQDFSRTSSDYVAKMPLANLENPQVYTVITKELLKSQVVTNFDDALKNTSGLDKLWSSTGRPGDGAAYFSLRGFATQASMVNGIASISNAGIDPANVETIEVIKGPSGALYGGAPINFGGLINIVTKKPLDTLGGSVNYTAGSYAQHRVTADVYGPLTANKKLTGRLNTAYHHRGTFQDAGFSKSIFVAPSLAYQVNDRLNILLEAEVFDSEVTNPLMIFLNRGRQLFARTPGELAFDYNKSYTNNDVTAKTPTTNLRGTASYKISDRWTSTTNVNYNRRKSDGYYQYVSYNGTLNDTIISRLAAYQNSVSQIVNAQQNFVGDFNIGAMRNRLLIGLDYLSQQTENHHSPYVFVDSLNTSIDDPRYGNYGPAVIDAAIAASTSAPTNNRTRNQVFGAYISNMLDITPSLHLLLALRVDRFDNKGTFNFDTDVTSGNYLQTAFSPKAGLVYAIWKDQLSVFANYQNGFKNLAPVVQPFPDISGILKPQQANQWEGGVKMNLLQNRLALTASYYNISVTNSTRGESIIRDGRPYNITVQDGTRLSRGFEIDLTASPLQGLQLIASYSYNDSEMTNAAASVNGRRPVEAGPKNLANFWATYAIPTGLVKGLGAGFGINYASENVITNSLPTGEFTLPAYTLVNASVFYRYKQFDFAVKGNNLSDTQYFRGWTTVEPQMRRNWLGSVAYSF
ncbi:TonB-dependent receptor [Sphingobacterium oryzagri]|uniref:TonB-dependent receptor n=1 Tax=Sphingobacterium oryzagri TaxID=3025669 RepID=A0ABY7WDC8_9SPHI|nr:TonB-dependent receptor [Sphingobacterium sp. KACC 22765]WDF67502.1 TonB-dependent receptor [Sphingobacterium sp. KACC 22765]